ncbi:hypothetical protein DMB42_26555 [Nonomuraea sp. WAC 01424]|nr:hypothetical protein DMB42_26555 [Nonomuraea sp. WAC 01424]
MLLIGKPLRTLSGCQQGFGEDVDVDGRSVVGTVEVAFGPVPGDRALDDARADAGSSGGREIVDFLLDAHRVRARRTRMPGRVGLTSR